MTDNLITVRALAARTREGRETLITRTVERITGTEYVTDALRAALALDLAADLTANGGTLSIGDAATKYGMSKSQANRYGRAGSIVATHDEMRDAVLAVLAADDDSVMALIPTLAPVMDLLAVIGRNGTDRPAPSATEVKSVALAPSADPVAALDALIDARPVTATGEESGEESGESGEESGEATPEELAARDAVMAREALARIMARDGASVLIPADEWNAIVAQVTEITAARRKASNRARASKPAA
jgi:hypothetical protein